MEKGNSWLPSSTKPNNSELKSKQDVSHKFLRLPRNKESVSPRPEARRKPTPQKSQEAFDKRPRNRTGAFCEKYRSEVADHSVDEPLTKQRCKKMSLNHLLNFTLKPSEHRDVRTAHSRYKLPKYNKELFLQANCQFVARENGDYSVHETNPDLLVEWDLIEEIRFPSWEVPLCPICLYEPIAGKITRCGHIYCWPCILHYLALTDKMWQKCPICFEAVHKTELKSVSLKLCEADAVGKELLMCLMKREKDGLRPVPSTHPTLSTCHVTQDGNISRFQKLLVADPSYVLSIVSREFNELQAAFEREKDEPEACFIEAALKLLQERKEKVLQTQVTEKIEGALPEIKKENCFFYQAEDGQHIYLHNLNVRMLLQEYGSLEHAPPSIRAAIVEIESASITEALRKRYRHLKHLPLTCEFRLVELDFSHLLSRDTLREFQGEILKRQQLRHRKARDERRWEKCIEVAENKKLGKYPAPTFSLDSNNHFPAYDDFQPLTIREETAEPVASTSFAQMLKAGKAPEKPPPISEEEEKGSPPEYRQSFGDAIQAALDAMAIQDETPAGGRRKKKTKSKLLFTTSMCRN